MAKFEFTDKEILIDGISSMKVAETLKGAGLAESKIGEIIGYWYVGATGNTEPVPFSFATDVETVDPNCQVTYARTFAHVDWVDGEDRVQAGATPEELGFNGRFHSIENEFDAISAQLHKLGACGAELRADLIGVAREIESKLTALQNDLYELRKDAIPNKPGTGQGLGILGSVKVGERDAFITGFGNDFKLVEFAGSTLGGTNPKVLALGTGLVFNPARVDPGGLVELTAGMEEAMLVPGIRELVNRPDGATVAEIRAVAGGLILPGGETLASVLAAMPADTQLTGAPGAVEAITAHVVGALPADTVTATTTEVITESGLRRSSATTLRAAAATGIGVDPALVAQLTAAGVDPSVGALASTTTAALADRLAAGGATVSSEDLRLAVARARVAAAIRDRSR